VGVGEWDKLACRYLYEEFAPSEEAAALEAIVASGRQRGLRYVHDGDSAANGAHVRALPSSPVQ